MKVLLRFCGLLLACTLLAPAARAQLSSLKVSRISIQHVGPPAASDDFIRANIRIKVGDPYLRLAVDDDVRNLYATGLFYTIRVADEFTNDGVVLTYVLQGKPQLTTIKFQGNTKYSDQQLKRKLTSKIGQPLDEQKLFTDSQEIEKRYEKAGRHGTTVRYLLNIERDSGRGVVTFDIKESPKIKIADVEFVGAQAFSQRTLRKVVKTRRHWMFSWLTRKGFFKDEDFEDDKERLAQFYRSKGYIDFELKDVQIEHPTPNTMVVRFIVYEGRRYKVGAVKFTGNKLFTTEQIKEGLRALQPKSVLIKKIKLGPNGLKMDVGDVFTPQGYIDNIRQIEDFYGSRGYLDVVNSGRNLDVVRIPNTETGTMDLEFKIDEGQQNRIEKIEIRGNTKTKDKVIRRELLVSPGEIFDMVKVRTSRSRLEQMGGGATPYFSKVDLQPEATEPAIPGRKNLVVGVDEAETGRMTVGAGLSSDSGLIGFAEVQQGNFDLFHPPRFTGGGQKFRLRATLGTQQQDYLMSFVEPWFLGRHLQLGTDFYYRDLRFQSVENLYDERRAGTHISLTPALGSESLVGTFGYTFEDVGILFNGQVGRSNNVPNPTPFIPNTLLAEGGYTLLSKFDASLAYDTRNSVELSDKGQRTELSAEIAGPFGGEKDFYKLGLKTHWYFKGPFNGHVLELLGGIGVADSYGSTRMVPFYERYYLGGLYSLRGYRYRSVSPRDPPDSDGFQSKEPVGGDSYWFGSAEYSVPIISHLRFAVFYDIGNVLLNPYDFNVSNFNDNWGLGLRLNIPRLGPLRLDYGIPIHHDKFNGGSGRIQFGASFDRPF